MYAFIYEREGEIWMNLKCMPMQADFLRSVYKSVIPGFHSNKKHWNTDILNGDVPNDKIIDMNKHSFELTKTKNKKESKI